MIIDKIRDSKELVKLFNERPITDFSTDFIINNPHIYCFYQDNVLMGCIFFTQEEEKLFIHGFSKPKLYKDVIDSIKIVCNHYKEDIYCRTRIKSAIYALLKAGFKKIDNIYKRSFDNGRI